MAKSEVELIILREGSLGGKNSVHKCTSVLVKTPNFTYLIDPGSLEYIRDIADALKVLGMTIKDIDFITYTHEHEDHIGSIEYFKDRHISVIDPFHETADSLLMPSIHIMKTKGHVANHVSFYLKKADVFEVKNGKLEELGEFDDIIIAGDAVINKEYLQYGRTFPGTKYKLMATRSRGRIYRIAKLIIPGHGPCFETKDVTIIPHNLTSEEYIDNLERIRPKGLPSIKRNRDFEDYLKILRNSDLPLPEIEPGQRILDLGSGYCHATLDLIKKVDGGYCPNKKCYRHSVPYHYLPTLVDFRCNEYITGPDGKRRRCNSIVDTGRVVAVDLSEESLEICERYLRKNLDDRYVVIRASESELKNIEVLKKYGVSPGLDRRNLIELDRKLNRKVIPLYQISIVQDISLPMNYFDRIFGIFVLTYVEDLAEALMDIFEILKVGGRGYFVGSHPMFILKKDITPEVWSQILLETVYYGKNAGSVVSRLGIADIWYPKEFYEKFIGDDYVEVTEGREPRVFMVEKLKEMRTKKFLKLKKRINRPDDPLSEDLKNPEKLAIRIGYRLYPFYKIKKSIY